MLKRILSVVCCVSILGTLFSGCAKKPESVKIGVSFGVGAAARWPQEQAFMEARAKELGVNIETRFNTTDEPKTQEQDCKELIDSGIDVLILIPRNVNETANIISYAKEKKVSVISYARLIQNEGIDLYVGYDSNKMGQRMGQFLAELVDSGDYIFLKGDENDKNALDLHAGAMRYLDEIKGKINVILDTSVAGWSAELAKQLVMDAVSANGNKVDAILAPNDKLAGAAIAALQELGITEHVAITGMDAELDAVQRVAAGTQDMTIYLDLKSLADAAIDEAINLATGKKTNANGEVNNGNDQLIPAHLVVGELVTQLNLDRILIDSGYYTKEQVYGK